MTTSKSSMKAVAFITLAMFLLTAIVVNFSACGGGGGGSDGTPPTTTQPEKPGQPKNLIASAGNAKVNLSWQKPDTDGGTEITKYLVYRDGIKVGENTTTDYEDPGLTNGLTYSYQVSAVNSVGEGEKSNEVSATPTAEATTPSAPRDLQATAGDGEISLNWDQPSSDGGSTITNYRIYRGTEPGNLTFQTEIGTEMSYTINSVNGTTYYCAVSAVNSVGEGPVSNEASATPEASTTVNITTINDRDEIEPGVTVRFYQFGLPVGDPQITDEDGSSRFTYIPPGTYNIDLIKSGFSGTTYIGVTINEGENNLTLQIHDL